MGLTQRPTPLCAPWANYGLTVAPSDDTILQFGSMSQPPNVADLRRVCPVCARRFTGDAAFCPYDGERLTGATGLVADDSRLGLLVDGRYRIERVLGEGGMGTVYRVRHATLERCFALKAMRRDLASEPEVAQRFIQEAKAAAAVSHPGVVRIIDFGALPTGEPYFVMDLLEGDSLSQVIRDQGPLSPPRILSITRQIAEALGAAHQVGVVHRDLKPDNVVLEHRDQVRVLDFGLAKVAGGSQLTRKGVVFGTPHYMSPEQAVGDPVDHRSDIYALGVLAFQMLTGRVPFEADTYMGVMRQHMFVAPPRPNDLVPSGDVPEDLESVVMRCLLKDPAERFQRMEQVVAALEAPGGPATALSLPSPPRVEAGASPLQAGGSRGDRVGARSWGLALVVLALAAAAVVAAVSWHLGRRPAPPRASAVSPPLDATKSVAATGERAAAPASARAGGSSSSSAAPVPAGAPATTPSVTAELRQRSLTPEPKVKTPVVADDVVDPWQK